jgi:hypothetical protein
MVGHAGIAHFDLFGRIISAVPKAARRSGRSNKKLRGRLKSTPAFQIGFFADAVHRGWVASGLKARNQGNPDPCD